MYQFGGHNRERDKWFQFLSGFVVLYYVFYLNIMRRYTIGLYIYCIILSLNFVLYSFFPFNF